MVGAQALILVYADWDVLAFVKCEFFTSARCVHKVCTCLEPLTFAAQRASSEGCW